ncbi:hypothetical protein XCR1_990026 [Xenorhabdus cabanillasii JM26]|uniref:Uncharacterized protein n=1 Tax=Xenorhabdus cabanillasii JM26 TaxID=1427517 RepID=W1JCD9_9GAMM|nr:hypothetical protein XCR1_990026 [Xenorhabdus cabanillasii JM26]
MISFTQIETLRRKHILNIYLYEFIEFFKVISGIHNSILLIKLIT